MHQLIVRVHVLSACRRGLLVEVVSDFDSSLELVQLGARVRRNCLSVAERERGI